MNHGVARRQPGGIRKAVISEHDAADLHHAHQAHQSRDRGQNEFDHRIAPTRFSHHHLTLISTTLEIVFELLNRPGIGTMPVNVYVTRTDEAG